ncbi:MAG: hypothetical protein JW867_05335 [Candidatus Omnitrophica bacterium]|nr:hypothetical protein [Candidatus Omnitrophota bacterium]
MNSRFAGTKDVFLTAILLCLVLLTFIIYRGKQIENTQDAQLVSDQESSETEDYQLDEFSYLVVPV